MIGIFLRSSINNRPFKGLLSLESLLRIKDLHPVFYSLWLLKPFFMNVCPAKPVIFNLPNMPQSADDTWPKYPMAIGQIAGWATPSDNGDRSTSNICDRDHPKHDLMQRAGPVVYHQCNRNRVYGNYDNNSSSKHGP